MKQAGLNNPMAPVLEALASLRRYRWPVFLASLCFTLIAVVLISLMPDVYRATTTILVDPQKIPDRYVVPTVNADAGERLNTLKQQVLSATKLQEIIEKYNLYPEMRKKASMDEVLDTMRRKIEIELKQGSGAGFSSFSITFEGSDPKVVAEVANQLAGSFIDWNLKIREQQSTGTTKFLSSEMEQAKQSLEEQESQLRNFRMAHLGEMPDQQAANIQALSRLQVQLQGNNDAMNRIEEQKTLLSQIRSPQTRDTSSLSERDRLLLEKSQLENQVLDLQRRYTSEYPDVVDAKSRLDRVNAQLAALPPLPAGSSAVPGVDSNTAVRIALLDKQAQRLREEQASIKRQIAAYQAKVDAVPLRETEMAQLTRNYEISKQQYQSLLEKTYSAEMADDLERKQQAERFTILDPARVPEKPYQPKRLPLMAAMVMVSIVLSVGTVLGFEFLSPCIRNEEEVKSLLPPKVFVLATIPAIDSVQDARGRRKFALQALAISLVACALVAAFLLKVRPIL